MHRARCISMRLLGRTPAQSHCREHRRPHLASQAQLPDLNSVQPAKPSVQGTGLCRTRSVERQPRAMRHAARAGVQSELLDSSDPADERLLVAQRLQQHQIAVANIFILLALACIVAVLLPTVLENVGHLRSGALDQIATDTWQARHPLCSSRVRHCSCLTAVSRAGASAGKRLRDASTARLQRMRPWPLHAGHLCLHWADDAVCQHQR